MIAKYVYMHQTIENNEKSVEFEETKVIELNSVSDLIKLLQDFVENHPEVEFDESGGELSIVEWHQDGTAHWLDIEQERD